MLEGVAIEIQPVSGYAELERWVAARNEVVPDDTDTMSTISSCFTPRRMATIGGVFAALGLGKDMNSTV